MHTNANPDTAGPRPRRMLIAPVALVAFATLTAVLGGLSLGKKAHLSACEFYEAREGSPFTNWGTSGVEEIRRLAAEQRGWGVIVRRTDEPIQPAGTVVRISGCSPKPNHVVVYVDDDRKYGRLYDRLQEPLVPNRFSRR